MRRIGRRGKRSCGSCKPRCRLGFAQVVLEASLFACISWKKNGDLISRLKVEHAVFILGPLEQLRAELLHVQITVQVTQQQRKTATGEQCETATGDTSNDDIPAYVKLQDYFSELKRDGEYPNVVRDCESQGEGI